MNPHALVSPAQTLSVLISKTSGQCKSTQRCAPEASGAPRGVYTARIYLTMGVLHDGHRFQTLFTGAPQAGFAHVASNPLACIRLLAAEFTFWGCCCTETTDACTPDFAAGAPALIGAWHAGHRGQASRTGLLQLGHSFQPGCLAAAAAGRTVAGCGVFTGAGVGAFCKACWQPGHRAQLALTGFVQPGQDTQPGGGLADAAAGAAAGADAAWASAPAPAPATEVWQLGHRFHDALTGFPHPVHGWNSDLVRACDWAGAARPADDTGVLQPGQRGHVSLTGLPQPEHEIQPACMPVTC